MCGDGDWRQVSALKERLAGAERKAEELALKQVTAMLPRRPHGDAGSVWIDPGSGLRCAGI